MGRLATLLRLLREARGATWEIPLQPGPLVICRSCGADTVVPLAWDEVTDSSWWMQLRCGACGYAVEVVVDDEQADAFDRTLCRHRVTISAALAASERGRMEEDLHVLARALELDLIDADDFVR